MSSRRGRPFLGGGTDGNERLTAVAGVLLLVLFAVIGVTIIRIGQLLWLVAMVPHLLGHLVELPPALCLTRSAGPVATGGGAGRAIALTSAVVAGAVLAIVLLPDFGAWTAAGAHLHHHHHG